MNLIAKYTLCLGPLILLPLTPLALAADLTADGDFIIGPEYTNAPELTVNDGVPHGTIREFMMNSVDSKIYPGLKGPYQRNVWVYFPVTPNPSAAASNNPTNKTDSTAAFAVAANSDPGKGAPFIVVQDGKGYTNTLPRVLDNLIHAHRLPPMIAIMINSGGGDGKGSERGLEYDTVSGKYAEFIQSEVLPKIERDYHVKFTIDPDGRAAMGGSSGGAAAFTMGWYHPELYHRILTYSGTYVAQESPDNPASPHGAWEYHEHFIPQNPVKPLRIWLEVGQNDNGSKRPEESYHNWVMANQRMAAALKAKNYHYQYFFAQGAGHVDGRVTRQTLPDALLWLWQGYPIK